jgi:hypothetical protein
MTLSIALLLVIVVIAAVLFSATGAPHRKFSQIALRLGDVLLLQGDKDRIADLERGRSARA